MEKRASVQDVIDRWPTLSDFARDAGVSYGAAKQMRRRSSIPVQYWPALIRSDVGVSTELKSDDLMTAHALSASAA